MKNKGKKGSSNNNNNNKKIKKKINNNFNLILYTCYKQRQCSIICVSNWVGVYLNFDNYIS